MIPFPVDAGGLGRSGIEQVRLHTEELDRELLQLARGTFRGPGEWARQTATPLVRIWLIRIYLTSLTITDPEKHVCERRQLDVEKALDELGTALSATTNALTWLSDPTSDTADRREVLAELSLHRTQQQRILAVLLELLKQPSIRREGS